MGDDDSEMTNKEVTSVADESSARKYWPYQTLHNAFQSPIIKVIVGTEEDAEEYHLHRQILCDVIPFFDELLNSECAEAKSGIVKLPEENPAAFEQVIKWIYGEVLGFHAILLENRKEDWKEVVRLVQAYVLADKFCMEELQNMIMDAVKMWHSFNLCCYIALIDQKGELLPDLPIRNFFIQELAYSIKMFSYARLEKEYSQPTLAEVISKMGENISVLMTAICKDRVQRVSTDHTECSYHVHHTTSACYEDKPIPKKNKKSTR